MEYRLLIDLEAVELIQRMPKRVRDDLLAHLERIRNSPSRYADFHEHDAIGRQVEISIYRQFAIHHWTDFADRHVKVLALKLADK